MTRTALITHPDCARHEIAPGHPEQPARIAAVLDELKSQGLLQEQIEAPEAERSQLVLAHPEGPPGPE